MSNDRLPSELDSGNLAREWPGWKRNFQVYMIANDKMNDPEMRKIAMFLWLIGAKATEIYNSLFPNDGTENSLLGMVENVEGEEDLMITVYLGKILQWKHLNLK